MADTPVRNPNSPSNSVGRSPLNDAFDLWTRMWNPLYRFDPHTNTETTTLTGNNIYNFVSETNAKNPSQEKEILENVASYGKQIGRINDALNVLIPLVISRMDATDLKQNERQALEAFFELYKEIAKVKGEHIPPDETQLDLLLEDIRALKDRDNETYQNLLIKLRDFAATE